MYDYLPADENESRSEPGEQISEHEGEKTIEEKSLVTKEKEEGMDMGTAFKEDKEQDLDDLLHSQSGLKKDMIPPPEDI